MKKITNLVCVFFLLMTAVSFAQGVTTSSINGRVLDNTDNPLPGANVVAVHQPSGSTYGATTDFDGFYRISNMRVGGPYLITISYVGFQDFAATNVNLQLGDSKQISTTLSEEENALDEIVITGQRNSIFDSGKTGAETNVSQRQVENLPTLGRNIADFARLTPQAQVSGDDVVSISGQNNRYNALYIDGAVNNDVFGLAGNGTNGGQTGVSPIALDAIESFQINVAPFDVRQSGFAGGSINAITKSGTNKFEGSAYGYYRNQDLAGKTPVDLVGNGSREKLNDFTAKTYGIRLGGPIIENKLFFFVNYERQKNETPQPFNVGSYTGNSTEADINNLSNFLVTNYGYNPGDFRNNTSSLESDKLIAKIDWNINNNNKLSLKHSYVKAVNFDIGASNANSINFSNRAVNFESTTNSTALELSSRIGDKFANNLIVGYTTVNDDRNFAGSPFPAVQIFDGSNQSISFGSEAFSTANLLEQKNLTITDNFDIYAGRHNITIGTNNEFSSSKNVFFRQNFGEYRYNNLNDFISGNLPNRYRHGYSLLGGFGDDSQGAAEFDIFQFGFYAQDQITVTDNLKVTLGIRFDVPFWDNGLVNEDFNTRTVGLLEAAGKDLEGARVGMGIDANVHYAPRFGFNWDVNGDKSTQIRGGIGVFTSRLPLVWPGGAYNNNGVTAGFIEATSSSNNPDRPVFNPDPRNQLEIPAQGSGAVGGQIDLFVPDFKLPQVLKTNIAFDQKLPGNFILSGDFIYNDNISAVSYENVNLEGPQFTTTGAGARPHYAFARVDDTYSGIFLGSNTSKGSSYNVSGTLTKNFYGPKVDVTSQVSYSYGDSEGIFDATSSQNSSQWNNLETVNGSNMPDVTRSDFAAGHRIIANSTVEYKWTDNIKTRLGVFYEGVNGQPFSYVVNDRGNLLRDTGSSSALAYVPANEAEALLVDDGDFTAAQQYAALSAYIDGDDYLRSRKGQFAERNADRSDWSHIIDLKFAQEFGIKVNGNDHKLEFTADIFNFTNLLNKDWGVRTFTNFGQVSLVSFEGFAADGTTPQYTFDPTSTDNARNLIDDSGLQSSRWQMQVGVRYSFN